MSILRFTVTDRAKTSMGRIVRFDVHEGESEDGLCWLAKLCMSQAKFDVLVAQVSGESFDFELVQA